MNISDDQIFQFMQDIKGAVGRIEANQVSTNEHLESVSKYGKETADKLDKHEKDLDAHGQDAVAKHQNKVIALVSFAISLLAAYLGFRHKSGG